MSCAISIAYHTCLKLKLGSTIEDFGGVLKGLYLFVITHKLLLFGKIYILTLNHECMHDFNRHIGLERSMMSPEPDYTSATATLLRSALNPGSTIDDSANDITSSYKLPKQCRYRLVSIGGQMAEYLHTKPEQAAIEMTGIPDCLDVLASIATRSRDPITILTYFDNEFEHNCTLSSADTSDHIDVLAQVYARISPPRKNRKTERINIPSNEIINMFKSEYIRFRFRKNALNCKPTYRQSPPIIGRLQKNNSK